MIDPAESARLERKLKPTARICSQRSLARFCLRRSCRSGMELYRSFIPFAPYVRGFASGSWGWRRCQGHIGAIYWDTVQSADP